MQTDTKMKWEGRWDQLTGRVKQAWGQLTDDDLDVADGEFEELVGIVKEKTGESDEEIRRQLESF